MRVQTFTCVIGGRACDGRCFFCVSGMTGFAELPHDVLINLINLKKSCRLAQIGETTTVLFSGKGEPFLYPRSILEYLDLLEPWCFPLVEVQTNGLALGRLLRDGKSPVKGLTLDTLKEMREKGLNTIAISTVGSDPDLNREVYADDYPSIVQTIDGLHRYKFTVRLCTMMIKGGVDSPAEVDKLIAFAKKHGIEQLNIRPIRKPDNCVDEKISREVDRRKISRRSELAIRRWVRKNGTLLSDMMHGAQIFDVKGQNLCLTDCLTVNKPGSDDIRTLIFYSNGRLTYDWQHPGAVILGGWDESEEKVLTIRKS